MKYFGVLLSLYLIVSCSFVRDISDSVGYTSPGIDNKIAQIENHLMKGEIHEADNIFLTIPLRDRTNLKDYKGFISSLDFLYELHKKNLINKHKDKVILDDAIRNPSKYVLQNVGSSQEKIWRVGAAEVVYSQGTSVENRIFSDSFSLFLKQKDKESSDIYAEAALAITTYHNKVSEDANKKRIESLSSNRGIQLDIIPSNKKSTKRSTPLTIDQKKELTFFGMKSIGLGVSISDLKNHLSMPEVYEVVATGLNVNQLLCAELIDVRPLEIKSKYEASCIVFRGGNSKKEYIIDAMKGVAFDMP